MRGPQGAAVTLGNYLRAALPGALGAIRAEEGLDAIELPDPALVAADEIDDPGAQTWPVLVISPQRLSALTVSDTQAGVRTYDVAYLMRIDGYLRGGDFLSAGRANRRYALGVRDALITRPTARAGSAPWGPGSPRLDLTTLAESYDRPFEAADEAVVAHFRTEIVLRQEERRPTPAPNLAVAVEVDTTLWDRLQ